MNLSEKLSSKTNKIKKIDEIINQLHILQLQQYQKVLIAVSGGIDSMVLMNATALVALNNKNIKLQVATIDHNIRENSAKEAQFVVNKAKQIQLNATIIKNIHVQISKSIPEKAREIRYKLLYHHANNIGADCILTAHNAEDNIETLLMRLRKGSGIKGLAAIQKVNKIANIYIVRPFNCIKRQEIEEWAHKNKIYFVNDPSNQNEQFERIKVRNLWKKLAEQGWNTEITIKSIQKIQNAYDAIKHIAQQQKHKYCKNNPLGFVEIKAQMMQDLHSQIAIEIIAQIIQKVNAKHRKYYNTNSQKNQTLINKMKMQKQNFPQTNLEQASIQYLDGKFIVARQNNRNIPDKLLLKKDCDNFFDNKFICKVEKNKINLEKRELYILYPTKKFIQIINKNIRNSDKIYRKLLPVIPVIKNINKNRKQRHHQKFADKYYIPHNIQKNRQYIKFVQIDIAKNQIIKQKPPLKVEFQEIHQFQQINW